MDAYPEKDEITTAFRWECSTRRAAKVLALKRQRMREDLQQTIEHLGLIVPPVGAGDRANDLPTEIVREALDRLGDRAFVGICVASVARVIVEVDERFSALLTGKVFR